MATVFTPGDSIQFQQGLAYYFGDTGTLPSGGWTATQVGTWGSPSSPSPTRALIGSWNVRKVTLMDHAFSPSFVREGVLVNSPNRALFNEDIGGWDTSNVTSMGGMFNNSHTFNQDITGWDTSNVTAMDGMFGMSSIGTGVTPAFNQDIRVWVVNSGVSTNLTDMFRDNSTFQAVYSVAGTPTAAFFNQTRFKPSTNAVFKQGLAYYFGEGPLPSGWTADQIGTATGISQTISTWDTANVTDMSDAFENRNSFNTSINNWNVSEVTDMSNMFKNASTFNQNIRRWEVSKVTDMQFMFRDSVAFDYDIRIWKILATTNLDGMFFGATAFLSAYGGASGWANVGQGTPSAAFFDYIIPTQPIFVSFGGMPNKTPYTTNASFAMGRILATRAYQSNPVPYKQFKTQNGGGTAGRLRRLKTQAAFGDATRTATTVVDVPGQPVQVTVTTTKPNFGGADPNIVNANLAKARNIGAAVPRNAIPR